MFSFESEMRDYSGVWKRTHCWWSFHCNFQKKNVAVRKQSYIFLAQVVMPWLSIVTPFNYTVLNACMYLIIEWKWNGMRAWTLDFHFMSLALFWIRMFLMFQVFLCILYTLFVKILPRTNFCTPSIKVQNSVLIFAQFRAKFWLKQLFCIAFFKI